MALQQKIDFKNGVSSDNAYLEVTNITLDYANNVCNFTLKTFLNKETKDAGLNTIIQPEYFNAVDSKTPGTSVSNPEAIESNFTKYFLVGDPRKNAEDYLLTLEKFKDAIKI